MSETCSTCRFILHKAAVHEDGWPEMVYKYERWLCRRYPHTEKKMPHNWCGEFQHQPKEGGHG